MAKRLTTKTIKSTAKTDAKKNGKNNEKVFDGLPDPKKFIIIRGNKVNNLKNVDIDIPKYKLVVVTGVSGSGKTSLVFDTIYAEGQRRYVESLSSYARQFLERMNKPDVDYISGLAPSMAIEQRTGAKTARSTVGTSTEVYDYLRLLFARVGKIYSPVSGRIVYKDTTDSIIKEVSGIVGAKKSTRVYVYYEIHITKDIDTNLLLESLKSKGYFKILEDGESFDLNEMDTKQISKAFKKDKTC